MALAFSLFVVQAKLDGILASRDAFIKSLKACTNLAILNIPKGQRKKTLAELDFFPAHASEPESEEAALIRASASADHGRDPGQSVADQINHAVQAQLKSTQKRGRAKASAASALKTPATARQAAAAAAGMAPPSTGVRRSSRKRGPPKTLDAETPLRSSRSRVMATPMITPKFDVNTPFNKSVFRLALPNEKLVSLSGKS